MSSGYVEYNNATGTAVASSLVKITMGTVSTIPIVKGQVRWSHMELLFKDSSTITAASIEPGTYISWDTDGIHIAEGPLQASVNLTANLNVSGTHYRGAILGFDVSPTWPESDSNHPNLYLFIKCNADAGNLIKARLHWHEIGKG